MTTASFDPLRPVGSVRRMRGWSRASRAGVPTVRPALTTVLDGLAQGLRDLMATRGRDLGFLFQPIVDVEHGRILGYEALTRGPADSPLHSPLVLFEVAARCGQLVEFERIVVRAIALRFRELGLPGRLFINLSPDSVIAAQRHTRAILDDMATLGVRASDIVIEVTETRPALAPESLRCAADALRQVGFAIALDDLGEGFSSLRRWVDMRPDYVKVDRHFVDGIASEPLKQQFVRSILEMASTSGSTVIAEGVELEEDLRLLRRIGVVACQGYLLARPSASPRASLSMEVDAMLRAAVPLGESTDPACHALERTAGWFARPGLTVAQHATCAHAIELFRSNPRVVAIPVLDTQQRPVGVLRSMQVLKRATHRYFVELCGTSACTELMDPSPLVFDSSASLRTMSQAVASVDDEVLGDGYIVTTSGRFVGVGRMTDLLKAVADLEISSARHANPLTALPGNVPIDQHLESMLRQQVPFTAAYWDISNFKACNDVYGYQCGDDVIRLAARLLQQHMDPQLDFVGHIGGDDFVAVITSPHWEQQVGSVCRDFDTQLRTLLRPDHIAAGGYVTKSRQGDLMFHALPTLCAGVLRVLPGRFPSARALAAAMVEPKQQAKRIQARSGFFIDRRGFGAPAPASADRTAG